MAAVLNRGATGVDQPTKRLNVVSMMFLPFLGQFQLPSAAFVPSLTAETFDLDQKTRLSLKCYFETDTPFPA